MKVKYIKTSNWYIYETFKIILTNILLVLYYIFKMFLNYIFTAYRYDFMVFKPDYEVSTSLCILYSHHTYHIQVNLY